MEYNFRDIEKQWQDYWAKNKTFRAETPLSFGDGLGRPKYYVLDMFPYPSGAGLHVGHPLGYIASDIVTRYKRLLGFNVLHPMGYDSFGLPAEQYAIQTGQHPAITTEQNIKRYREQLDKIGFSFDWEREVKTSDPKFYKWTQWIFLKLFNSWYNTETDKAEPIENLTRQFEIQNPQFAIGNSNKKWNELSEKESSDILMSYRLAYLSEAWVNWCPQLGTVLANDEVKDGVSERGGYPVERKLMPQWSLRITAYAERLLKDLDSIDWSESIKEAQRNWIGKSEGSSLEFRIQNSEFRISVFTTRPDTVFGVTFLTLAPENELVEKITTPEYKKVVDEYAAYAKNKSERDRQADVKKVTGQFTGAHAIHPFTEEKIPIWIGEYVLAGYGTGAVMGVPAHDMRDFAFAKHFGLSIKKVIEPNSPSPSEKGSEDEAIDTYDGKCINSDLINGLEVKDAIKKIISEIEKRGLGKGEVNYRLRDAIFGRQRYWGEPIPIYYENGIPKAVDEKDLPVILPEVDKYLPTETGEPPLARAASTWKYKGKFEYEKTTMPGWAGSSWYFLRYMDAQNEKEFVSKDAGDYWDQVDLYIGGSEHATGHLLYFRFWTKLLYDLGYIPITEPAKKLINQGMIQGESQEIIVSTSSSSWEEFRDYFGSGGIMIYDVGEFPHNFRKIYSVDVFQKMAESKGKKLDELFINDIGYKEYRTERIDINILTDGKVSINKLLETRPDLSDSIFVCGSGLYHQRKFFNFNKQVSGKTTHHKLVFFNDFDQPTDEVFITTLPEVEKMSKSKLNVVNPDVMCDKYGADCFRMYEMFLGPLEQSKPWNTNGITGVFNFLKKFWKLFHAGDSGAPLSFGEGSGVRSELKILHKTIKKVTEDIERYSFNTCISTFMICVNELTDLKCSKKEILEPLVILISPFAPHIAEELWEKLGHKESITFATFPKYDEQYIADDTFAYPVSFNGKTRFNLELPLSLTKEEVEREVITSEEAKKFLQDKKPKKVIVVPGRIVNVVV